jgi:hypothetical protein
MQQAKKQQAADREAVEAVYGTIPSHEYASRRQNAYEPVALDSTMREDYELGVDDDGEFSISFSASCSTCGYRFMFETTEQTT